MSDQDQAERIGYKVGMWGAVVLIVALLIGALLGIWKLVEWLAFRPRPNPLTLSAAFEDGGTNNLVQGLRIHGDVRFPAAVDQNTWIKIIVENFDHEFRQASLVTATNGTFDLDGSKMIGLRSLRRDEPVNVTAEVWSDAQHKLLLREELFLNGQKPLLGLPTIGAISFVAIGFAVLFFLYAFTGQKTEAKNRRAIQFSYCIIVLGLVLPLMVPIVLPHLSPNLIAVISRKATPVGLVITRIANGKTEAQTNAQWVLNVGGAVELPPTIHEQNQDTNKAQVDRLRGEVIVHGGLVIPLWVILLSLIGGAINMTTKVPLYQEKMESEVVQDAMDSVIGAARWLLNSPVKLAQHIVPGAEPQPKKEPGLAAAEPPQAPQPAPAPQKAQAGADRPTDDDDVGKVEREHWRRGLVGLYMSLVSAPFLAIVTYYLLEWGDLAKTPVLVIVSFSIGLLSARIVRSITDLAGGFIDQTRRKTGDQEAPS